MMRSTRVLVLLAVCAVLAALVSGCASARVKPVELTSKDGGSEQSLAVGQQLRVTLDANPTTGYEWAVDGPLPSVLESAGEPAYTAQSNAIGGGGVDAWTFVARSSGAGTLRLKYWRSFEPTVAPVKTFEVQVNVR